MMIRSRIHYHLLPKLDRSQSNLKRRKNGKNELAMAKNMVDDELLQVFSYKKL